MGRLDNKHKIGIAALAVIMLALAMPNVLAASKCNQGFCDDGQGNCVSCPSSCGDGSCSSGENCGNCVADCGCQSGQTCNSQNTCVTTPPPPLSCGNGICEPGLQENSNTCEPDCPFNPPGDADNDGHNSTITGGDDCNDADPNIHPGAPELCDGKDNNCNGIVDEGCPQKGLLFFNKTFRGCGLNRSDWLIINDTFQSNQNYALGVTNETYCASLGSSWYCDFDGLWKNNSMYDPRPPYTYAHVSTISADPSGSSKGCCPSGWCFEGTGLGCLHNQTGYYDGDEPLAQPFQSGNQLFRCASGNWVNYIVKYDWTGQFNGTCDGIDDCYYKNQQTGKGACAGNKTFVGDHYCVGGNWTTRTKYLALQLIDYVSSYSPNEYVLFCDDYKHSLNDFGYASPGNGTQISGGIPGGNSIEYYLASGCPGKGLENPSACANNFCTLRFGDPDSAKGKVIVAVSLNQEINASTYSFLDTLNKSRNTCDAVIAANSPNFAACSDSKIWYNARAKSVIYSKDAIQLSIGSVPTIDRIRNFFVNFIRTLAGLPIPSTQGDYSYIVGVGDPSRIYIAKHVGIDTTTAIIKNKYDPNLGITRDFLLINYTGFDFDVCNLPQVKGLSQFGQFNCTSDGASYYIVSQDPGAIELWPDFTAKLRQP